MTTIVKKHAFRVFFSKLEELGLHLDSRAMHTKMHDDILNITKTKTQKLVKDINIKHWKEEVIELQLQMQIEELHKNIQFFKQENEYIRCLAEKCRFLSGKIKSLQQLLPIRVTYSGEKLDLEYVADFLYF